MHFARVARGVALKRDLFRFCAMTHTGVVIHFLRLSWRFNWARARLSLVFVLEAAAAAAAAAKPAHVVAVAELETFRSFRTLGRHVSVKLKAVRQRQQQPSLMVTLSSSADLHCF